MNNRLLSVEEHAYALSRVLMEIGDIEFMKTTDWLNIAAGVDSVRVTTGKFDVALMFCSRAFDFEDKRSELISNMVTRLTIFQFIWGAFESFEKVAVPKAPKRFRFSTVSRVSWYLKENSKRCSGVAEYAEILEHLRYHIRNDDYHKSQNYERSGLDELRSEFTAGINIVRQVRNDLAHGSAEIPLPDDWQEGQTDLLPSEKRHLCIIDCCSRLVMLTMQMVMKARFCAGETVDWDRDEVDGEVPIEDLVERLHVEQQIA